jgi:hypothetical protein
MITTEEDRGYLITLDYDQDAESPREWDNLCTMTCWHQRQNLGDHQATDEEVARLKKMKYYAPLYLYEHSGSTISLRPFNDPWDSGQVGFIYVSVERLRENFGSKFTDEQVRTLMEGEVQAYDQWLRGDVYCYSISKDGEYKDSCCGFFGEDDTMDEARSMVTSLVEEERQKHQRQVKTYIRHHVPLEQRA